MKASTFVLGLTAGALAGAATILFSTPRSGGQIRHSVKHGMQDKLDDVRDRLSSVKDSLSGFSKEAIEMMPDSIAAVRALMEQITRSAGTDSYRLSRKLHAIQKSLSKLEQTMANQQ